MPNIRSLNALITPANIPGDIGILENAIDALLANISYDHDTYIRDESEDKKAITYSLELVTQPIALPLFGSQMTLLLFRDPTNINKNNISVKLTWHWPLRKYFDNPAGLQGFASTPEDFLGIFLELAKIEDEEAFFDKIANTFWGDALEDFTKFWDALIDTLESYKKNQVGIDNEISNIIVQVKKIQQEVKTTLKNNALKQIYLQYKANPNDPKFANIKAAADSIQASIKKLKDDFKVDIDVYKTTVPALLKNIKHMDVEKQLDKLFELFKGWIEGIDRHDLHKLLVPQIKCTIKDIRVDLEFPKEWSLRMKLDSLPGEPEVFIEETTTKRAAVEFPIGDLIYSTAAGFKFVNKTDPSININGGLKYSSIGKTGFIVSGSGFDADWSRTTNIKAADDDGRNKDFIGVYAKKVEFFLPSKWFKKQQGNTLGIYANHLLVGTGGISGTVGLQVVKPDGKPGGEPGEEDTMTFILGKQNASGTKGVKVVFEKFDLTFKQNKITKHYVKGYISIPRFNYKLESRSRGIDDLVNLLPFDFAFSEDGDFHITVPFKSGQKLVLKDIFTLIIKTAEIGRDDEKVYLQISGTIDFSNNAFMDGFLEDPLPIEKFRIYSDGSFEIEGGTIPLPESVRLKVKPVEVYVTAIHIGSHTQIFEKEERKYKYFGFDANVSVNPGGVKAEGNGMKYYFTVDDDDDPNNIKKHHHFFRIEGLSIDLIIPGSASPDKAVLLLSGFLNIKEDEYMGGIKFSLPKVKIAGGAAMRYKPSVPAFLVDVNLELPVALPLGNTSLGIYGFRGLFGLRYVAAKDAEAIKPPAANWFEYYKAPPAKGIRVQKFKDLSKTPGGGKPFSIGAGISLATMSDNGRPFSAQLFLLISIPNLILFEGRANILGPRLGIEDATEPPFYAMIAYSPGDSIITGSGVNYNIPRDGDDPGKILKLNVEIEAAYFFKNSKAWYVHIGTKAKPITAEILSIFNGYSYLVINAFGIEAGAGVRFAFSKNYCGGVVRASAKAYFDVWGRVIFPRVVNGSKEPTQFGGGVAVGGCMDVSLFGVALYLGFAASLTGEAPKPMRVAGSVELVVAIKLVVKNIEKRFTAEFVWEKSTDLDKTPICPLPLKTDEMKTLPGGAVGIKSGSTYSVQYFEEMTNTALMDIDKSIKTKIPINAVVDLQFDKPVLPNAAVSAKIGGFVNAAEGYEDLVPPAKGNRQVSHLYRILDVTLEVYADEQTGWIAYDPYKAMGQNIPNGKLGYWQKTGGEYNKIRLLAQSPFAYMQQGQPDWYTPEQFDLPVQVLLCQNKVRERHCAVWEREGKIWKPRQMHPWQGLSFLVTANDSMVAPVVKPSRIALPLALRVEAPGILELYLPEASVDVRVHVVEACPYEISVTWMAEIRDAKGNLTGYETVAAETKRNTELPFEFKYENDKKPISKAIVTPSVGDKARINQLELAILNLNDQILAAPSDANLTDKRQQLALLRGEWLKERGISCCFSLSERDKSDLKAYTEWVKVELEKCRQKQQQLNMEAAMKCKKGMPTRPCELAKEAAAANQVLCDQWQRTLNIAESVQARPIGELSQSCFYWVQKVCWLTERDHFYNINIPAQGTINADYEATQDAVEATLTPVWRPGKKYRVGVKVKDDIGGGEPILWFGFETARPFDGVLEKTKEQKMDILKDEIKTWSDPPTEEQQKKAYEAGIDDDGSELSLKYYLDFERSYPNADGRLVYAKPLYYRPAEGEPIVSLVFKDDHARHFFREWYDDFKGDPNVDIPKEIYAMDVQIQDPTEEGTGIAEPVIKVAERPQTKVTWEKMQAPQPLPTDLQLINTLLQSNQGCVPVNGSGKPVIVKPPPKEYVFVEAKNLRPDKLYAAIVQIKQTKGEKEGEKKWQREIHRFNFRTSRYPDFKSHIGSYRQSNDEGKQKDMVFTINTNIDTPEKTQILKVAMGVPSGIPALETNYHDPMDRILFGILKQMELPAPICTEVNVIRDKYNNVFGLLIRSPEAFNDPKLPAAELLKTIRLLIGGAETHVEKVFSKDGSQILLLPKVATWAFPANKISLAFSHIMWDVASGAYIEKATVSTDVLPID